uniref:Ribosomal protein S12 n=1 Tax=Gracilariopsis andersonii TaxID=172979 RepID=E5Q3E7_9FLOR|nr:ribosomal protein S12 [Gracilariopsis andersonii]ADR03230.1 ribosomal protein S12 [Gracilariopsis andersonii]
MPTINQLLKISRTKQKKKSKSIALKNCPQKKRGFVWKYLQSTLRNPIRRNEKLQKYNWAQANLLQDIFLVKDIYYKNSH